MAGEAVQEYFSQEIPPFSRQALYDEDEESVQSISTMATEDDLPGAGRILGNILSYYGRKLEQTLSKKAEKHGAGPVASAQKILDLIEKRNEVDILTNPELAVEIEDRIIREVRRLISYSL